MTHFWVKNDPKKVAKKWVILGVPGRGPREPLWTKGAISWLHSVVYWAIVVSRGSGGPFGPLGPLWQIGAQDWPRMYGG